MQHSALASKTLPRKENKMEEEKKPLVVELDGNIIMIIDSR